MSHPLPRHILVLRFSALGDIAMTVPVVASLARAYPDIRITVLTSPQGVEVYRAVLGNVENVEARGVDVRHEYHSLWRMTRLYRRLRPLHVEAVADLHDVLRTQGLRSLFRLGGIPVAVIDKGRREKRDLVAHRLRRQLPTSFERYHAVFSSLGYRFPLTYHADNLPLRDEGLRLCECRIGDDTMAAAFRNGGIGVGVAPFSRHKGKVYPAAMMEKMIDLLLAADADITVFMFGSPAERATLNEWAARHPRTVNCAGRGTVADDLAMMSALRVVVAMDSANMHLAALVGTPVVAVWGATHPWAGFLGWAIEPDDVMQADMDCRPCSIYGNKPCRFGTYACLEAIAPEAIAERVLTRIGPPRPTTPCE